MLPNIKNKRQRDNESEATYNVWIFVYRYIVSL